MIISPSLLNAGIQHLPDILDIVKKAGAEYLHVDVMDARFVPNMSFGPGIVKDLKKMTDLVLDVHLMIDEPQTMLPAFLEAGSDIVTIHAEATRHLYYDLQIIKQNGCKAGVAINPGTPVSVIEPVLPLADQVLVMTINPGRSNQRFLADTLDKVKELKKIRQEKELSYQIEVDGSITDERVQPCLQAGVDVFVAGGYIFNAEDPAVQIRKMLEKENEYQKSL